MRMRKLEIIRKNKSLERCVIKENNGMVWEEIRVKLFLILISYICIIKVTILNIFTFLNVESNSRIFSSFEIKPLYLLNSTSPSFPSPQSLTTTILLSFSMYLTTLSVM